MILYLFKIYRAEGLLCIKLFRTYLGTFYTKSMLPVQLFGIYMWGRQNCSWCSKLSRSFAVRGHLWQLDIFCNSDS